MAIAESSDEYYILKAGQKEEEATGKHGRIKESNKSELSKVTGWDSLTLARLLIYCLNIQLRYR